MADRKRKVLWKDALLAETSLAATTIINHPLVAESDVENLGDVTVTRIVGELSVSYASGSFNILRGAIWVSGLFSGAVNPTALNTTFFERSRVMWTIHRMVNSTDETTRIMIDIRTQRKLSSGVQLELLMENTSAVAVTHSFHIRSLLKLS